MYTPFISNLPRKESKYRTKAIGSDIVSIEIINKGILTFPFDSAHCYSNEKEITSSPMTMKDDPEENEEKMAKVIKIIHRIRKLQPSMTVFPIYHCVFSKYNEIPDDVY